MPGRQIVDGEQYRYSFQGQEKDPETGKEAFQLRLWDSRIGRWLTTDPYGQYHSPYLGMGNNPTNDVDPDGGLFGRIRAWIYKQLHGGSIMKNEFDKWVWTSDTTLSGNNTDGYISSDLEIKSFGYGWLGKFEAQSAEYTINSKVDFGFVYSRDKGRTGIDIKGPTVRLLEMSFGYKNGKYNQDMYYPRKDRKFKGVIYSAKLEAPVFDYKQGRTWETVSHPLYKVPYGIKTKDYFGVGRPYIEAKITDISKKGLSVHLGFQEDWGHSYGLRKIFGISGKVDFKAQSKINWKW